MKHTIKCLEFRPLAKNTLVGFATIVIDEAEFVVNGVGLHRKGESRWAGLPGAPVLNADGCALRDERGRIAYRPVNEIRSRAASDAFSAAVWRAVLEKHPEAAK
jgi:hypothetical protein